MKLPSWLGYKLSLFPYSSHSMSFFYSHIVSSSWNVSFTIIVPSSLFSLPNINPFFYPSSDIILLQVSLALILHELSGQGVYKLKLLGPSAHQDTLYQSFAMFFFFFKPLLLYSYCLFLSIIFMKACTWL